MHRFARALAASLLAITVAACGDEPTSPIREGRYLTTAEQVAIEYALAKVADTLDVRGGSQTDSIVADFARIVGMLVRREGRVQTVSVTLPGGTVSTMQAVVLWASGSFAGSAVESQVAVAWDGLDTGTRSVRRTLLLLGSGAPSGSYTLGAGSPSNAARLVDLASGGPATLWRNAGGAFTVTQPEFAGSCIGFASGAGDCTVGRETVAVAVTLSSGASTGTASHSARVLPAFHLVTR